MVTQKSRHLSQLVTESRLICCMLSFKLQSRHKRSMRELLAVSLSLTWTCCLRTPELDSAGHLLTAVSTEMPRSSWAWRSGRQCWFFLHDDPCVLTVANSASLSTLSEHYSSGDGDVDDASKSILPGRGLRAHSQPTVTWYSANRHTCS